MSRSSVGGGGVMLVALRYLDRELREVAMARPVMVVHDEVIVEASTETADEVAHLVERSLIQGMQDIYPDALPMGWSLWRLRAAGRARDDSIATWTLSFGIGRCSKPATYESVYPRSDDETGCCVLPAQPSAVR